MKDYDYYLKIIQEYVFTREKNPRDIYNNQRLTTIRKQLLEFFEKIDLKVIEKFPDRTTNSAFIGEIGQVNHDEGKYLLFKNAFICNDGWDYNKIQNCNNKYLKKVIQKSLKYFNKSAKIYEYLISSELYKNIDNGFILQHKNSLKITYGDMARIYYSINDFESFIEYSDKAIQYNSLSILALIIKYYSDLDDYDNVSKYYNLSLKSKVDYSIFDRPNISNNESSKYNCGIYYVNYLISVGEYEQAKNVAEETMSIIKGFKTLPINKLTEAVIKKIQICDDCINKFKEEAKNNFGGLSEFFEDYIIDMMDNNIKTYINTSIELYKYISSSDNELDYSASVISIMKALESMLYEIFANNYLLYLKEIEHNLDYDKINKNFKLKNGDKYQLREKVSHIEYGDAINLVGKMNPHNYGEWVVYDYFKDFCVSNGMLEQNLEETLNEFLNKLDDMRNKRNNIAHKNPFSKDDADYCINQLIIEHINYISFVYKIFNFCFNKKSI